MHKLVHSRKMKEKHQEEHFFSGEDKQNKKVDVISLRSSVGNVEISNIIAFP